jgi:hypothetical protein
MQSQFDKGKNSASSGAKDGGKTADKSEVVCHNCKKKGHYSRDCRSKKKSETTSAQDGASGATGVPNWRNVAPKSGEPTTKTVSGKTFNYCTKCKLGKGLWTPSHTTATHTGGKVETPATTTTPAAAANYAGVTGDGLGIYPDHTTY